MATFVIIRTINKFNTLRNRIVVENQLTEYKLVFFTNISHEFRTPLTLIQGALEKIENRGRLPQEMAYPIKVMQRSTQRLLRLVNQLLEFRKMQNKKLSLSLEELDVVAFLYDIFDSFNETAARKKMTFRFVPSVESCRLFIDKEKVDKIIYNLLSNAFKYTPDGGKITLSMIVDQHSEQLLVAVADNGIGIPKEKQSQLFSRFMQNSFSGDSMGIGLHLTYELVNIHKGTITFKENNGGGSVFTVSLPLKSSVYAEEDFLQDNRWIVEDSPEETSLLVSSEESEEPTDSKPLNKERILVIEDDVDVSEFLQHELSVYFEVISKSDGVAGLEYARIGEVNLIVCDVLMPGMNGFEVVRQLKSDFETSHIPVILLTAMTTAENQLEGVESGADAYITKPFSPKLLLARITQLITQRDKLRKKFLNSPDRIQPMFSSGADKQFLEDLHDRIEEHLSDPKLSAEELAVMMNLGRTTFFRKVRGVTGYSPNEYIRILKIKKAAELLLGGYYNVSEVSYQLGFSHPFYFSRCFKEQFGVPPSVYVREKQENNESESKEE